MARSRVTNTPGKISRWPAGSPRTKTGGPFSRRCHWRTMNAHSHELLGKQVRVLDKGFVELQSLMGDDLAIVNAARVSFLGESKGTDKDKKLLFYLMQHRHTSP